MAETKTKAAAKKAPAEKKTTATKATTSKKTEVAAATEEKKAPAKKAAAPKKAAAASITKPGAEERYRMIEVAAYYIAERNGFQGCSAAYWAEAEAQIARQLGE